MSDEVDPFDIDYLNEEETQEVVNWALPSAAMIVFMDSQPDADNLEDALEQIQGWRQAVDIMMRNLPVCLMDPAINLAQESYDEAVYEEEIVEGFLQQIEEL